jgi:hypothetical protein
MDLFSFHIAQAGPFREKGQADFSAVRMRGKRERRLAGWNTLERRGGMHQDQPGRSGRYFGQSQLGIILKRQMRIDADQVQRQIRRPVACGSSLGRLNQNGLIA